MSYMTEGNQRSLFKLTIEFNEEYENQIINEEYKIWKKNAPFLYDMVITHELDWPSLTTEWLSQKQINNEEDFATHYMYLATNTNHDQNSIMLASVKLPIEETVTDPTEYKQATKSLGGIQTKENRVQIHQTFPSEFPINRARYMPQNQSICAAKQGPDVCLYQFQSPEVRMDQSQTKEYQPRKLIGHTKDGYGLAWNNKKQGILLSGSNDNKICIWDINNESEKPMQELEFHKAAVEDVCWSHFQQDIFLSVGDDRIVCIWDTRSQNKTPTQYTNAHPGEIYTVDFNPFNENLFITGSEDRTIGLWDIRNTTKKLHSFESHSDSILKVQWSPHQVAVFGSASMDRRLNIWDLSKCGSAMKPEDEQDGPPELLFIHGGHRARVNDFSWNQNDSMVISSVEDNNILQVWQLASNIYEENDDDEMEDENSKEVV